MSDKNDNTTYNCRKAARLARLGRKSRWLATTHNYHPNGDGKLQQQQNVKIYKRLLNTNLTSKGSQSRSKSSKLCAKFCVSERCKN